MHVLGSQRAAATVGGLAHLKAVERGPRPFASGTYAPPKLFSKWAGTLQRLSLFQQPCRRTTSLLTATWSLATLLPSASCSLKDTVSASAQIGPAQPSRISRYMLSISMNYVTARSTSH
jgi:hypothetical protein